MRALPPRASSLAASVIPNGVDEELVACIKTEIEEEMAAPSALVVDGAAKEPTSRPLSVLYTSSYDRGLEYILRHGWPRVHAALPHAKLHLYYGWSTHEALYPTSAWRDEMRALIASFSASVVDHGRVGQPELLRAKARAQLLYYISSWPEIDCIAVREAACLGCVPLTSTFAVFGDVAKDYCIKVDGDPMDAATQHAAADVAIELLRRYETTGALPDVQTTNLRAETWARVAERWLRECLL